MKYRAQSKWKSYFNNLYLLGGFFSRQCENVEFISILLKGDSLNKFSYRPIISVPSWVSMSEACEGVPLAKGTFLINFI